MSSSSSAAESEPATAAVGEKSDDAIKQKQSNLQRIQQRKQCVRGWPRDKKIEKLGIYSSCKADADCKCNGWKNPAPPPNPPKPDTPALVSSLTDPCRGCQHSLGDHVSHLDNVGEEELDRLLGIVVDVENLFMCVHKEEDSDTKQVYFYLFKLLSASFSYQSLRWRGRLVNLPMRNQALQRE